MNISVKKNIDLNKLTSFGYSKYESNYNKSYTYWAVEIYNDRHVEIYIPYGKLFHDDFEDAIKDVKHYLPDLVDADMIEFYWEGEWKNAKN